MMLLKTGCLWPLCRVGLEIIALIAVLGTFVVWQGKTAERPIEEPVPIDQKAAVLERIHLVGELVTGIAVIQTVVKSTEVNELLRLQIGSTELLYVAVGEIRAGLNLQELDEKAIAVDGETVFIDLPPCKILDAKINVDRSYVFDVKRSLMLSPEAIHLQTAAERQALRESQETAIQAGLLEQADRQAKMLIRYWFESAGFGKVEIRDAGQAHNAAAAAQ